MDLMLFDRLIAFDHVGQKIYLIANVSIKDGEEGYRKGVEELEKMAQLI